MLLTDVQSKIAPIFDDVQSAVNLREAIKQPIHRQNIALVVPVSERPDSNVRDEDVGRPLQKSTITFGIVIGFKSINDATGSKGLEALEALRNQLRDALYGYYPVGHAQVMLGPSDLIQFVPGGLWWIDRFTTSIYYQSNC